LKAVQVARALDPPNDWDRWLTRVAINACRDRRRAGWWRRFRWGTDSIDRLELPAKTRDPDRLAIDAQLRDRLWRAFRALPGAASRRSSSFAR